MENVLSHGKLREVERLLVALPKSRPARRAERRAPFEPTPTAHARGMTRCDEGAEVAKLVTQPTQLPAECVFDAVSDTRRQAHPVDNALVLDLSHNNSICTFLAHRRACAGRGARLRIVGRSIPSRRRGSQMDRRHYPAQHRQPQRRARRRQQRRPQRAAQRRQRGRRRAVLQQG